MPAPGTPKGRFDIRTFFSGTYLNSVDSKNRLSVPAQVRLAVENRSGEKRIVLAPSEHAPCLVGYDLTFLERVEKEIEAQFAEDFGPGQSQKARNSFAMAEEFPYDDTGRITLSAIMRANGEIGKQALFLGAGNYFELWAPELLLAEPGQDPRLLRTVKAMLAGKGK